MEDATFHDGAVLRRYGSNEDDKAQAPYDAQYEFTQEDELDAPDEHHQEDNAKQQGRRREVFGEDKGTDNAHDNQRVFERFVVGTILPLLLSQHESHACYDRDFGNLRGLKLEEAKAYPARGVVGLVAK